jgi:hypothetical protein
VRSLTDLTDIKLVSSENNTSQFDNMAALGNDLFNRIPRCSIATGKELVNIIKQLNNSTNTSVNSLASDRMVPDQYLVDLRKHLPINKDNQPIGLINVIGLASGYLNSTVTKLLEGLTELNNTAYASQLLSAMEQIRGARPLALPGKISDYYNLLDTIASDQAVAAIVEKINVNFDYFCEYLSYEYQNYRMANITADATVDNNAVLYFVNSLGTASAEVKNLLSGMRQPSETGYILEAILAQAANTETLKLLGKRPVSFTA